MTSQASWSEAPVIGPLDSTQMTWDVYVSLRRQSPNTPAEIRVFGLALADVAAAEGFPE